MAKKPNNIFDPPQELIKFSKNYSNKPECFERLFSEPVTHWGAKQLLKEFNKPVSQEMYDTLQYSIFTAWLQCNWETKNEPGLIKPSYVDNFLPLFIHHVRSQINGDVRSEKEFIEFVLKRMLV